VQFADWRLIFLINLPVGIVAVLFGIRALPEIGAQRATSALDTLGAILGPLAFAALTFGISRSTADTWTGTSTLLGLGIGAVAFLAFVARELTISDPLLDLRVFRSVQFSLGIVTQWVAFASLMGSLFLVPLFLQSVRGYGAFDTGLYLLPNALAAAVAMPVGGILFDRLGPRVPAVLGLALVAAGSWILTQVISGTTAGTDLLLPLATFGFGLGLMMMPLNTYLLTVAPRDLVSRVTSLTAALQNVVAALAIAGLSTILSNKIADQMAAAQQQPGRPNVPALVAAAYHDTFWVVMGLALVGLVLAFTLRRSSQEHDVAREEQPVGMLA
jgi:EmrB/QacA subfamily drug resistance transporter